MKKHHLTSFYLEALLLVAVFIAMILVLTGVFGVSRAQSAKAERLTRAVALASNAAEAVSASGSLEQAAALLDEGGNVRSSGGKLEASYLADGTPCADGDGDLLLTLSWEPSQTDPALVSSRIEVYSDKETAPVYTLETASYRKGAAE